MRKLKVSQLGHEKMSQVGQENHVSGRKTSHSWVRRNCHREVRRKIGGSENTLCDTAGSKEKCHKGGSEKM